MSGLWRGTGAGHGAAWSRPRIAGLLTAVAAFVLLMVIGLGLLVRSAMGQRDVSDVSAPAPRSGPSATQATAAQRRDARAAAPMLAVSAEDSRSGKPAISPAPSITIPNATQIASARVPSGFPHTSEGAIGQLASIEVVVLQAMSMPRTVEVYREWADPAAEPAAQWRLTAAVRSFLGVARMGQQKDLTTTVTITPAAAQVKATDGRDWVVACVLVDVRAVIATEQRMAYGYCERMQWSGGRWTIAPGTPPAEAPSTWPGTELAAMAGWRTWQTG
jgi:hypothetical protein